MVQLVSQQSADTVNAELWVKFDSLCPFPVRWLEEEQHKSGLEKNKYLQENTCLQKI